MYYCSSEKNESLFFPGGAEFSGGENLKSHNRMFNLRHTLPTSHYAFMFYTNSRALLCIVSWLYCNCHCN